MTTRWAPAKKDVLRELASEILHNYARGRVLVAVDAPPGAPTRPFADDLAEALREQGHAAERASVADVPGATGSGDGVDAARVRSAIVEPFRRGELDGAGAGATDVVLVVDGPGLQGDDLRGAWALTLWLAQAGEARGGRDRARATIIVDASDPEHPRRVFDDAC